MQSLLNVFQVIIALGILNVWLLRFGKSTTWRGGDAQNMQEEFAVYGLPLWFMRVIGLMKVSFATLLLAGVWIPGVTLYGAVGMVALMTGAVAMHIKVKDPLRKSLPALSMLGLSIFVAVAAS